RRVHRLLSFCADTPTTEIYTLSLHDALPICESLRRPALPELWLAAVRAGAAESDRASGGDLRRAAQSQRRAESNVYAGVLAAPRSEEHTSELQSRENLVCRLLLEKKNKKK